MAQFAHFDPSKPSPFPVTGWYDTGLLIYPSMPPASDLVAVTAAQWEERMANPSGWAVNGGALVEVEMVAPSVPLAAQAKAALDASDVTAIRCVKAGVAFPAEWQAYCTTLRSIVAGAAVQVLPVRPDYPAGT